MKKTNFVFAILLLFQVSLYSQGWLWGTSISGNDILETEGVGID